MYLISERPNNTWWLDQKPDSDRDGNQNWNVLRTKHDPANFWKSTSRILVCARSRQDGWNSLQQSNKNWILDFWNSYDVRSLSTGKRAKWWLAYLHVPLYLNICIFPASWLVKQNILVTFSAQHHCWCYVFVCVCVRDWRALGTRDLPLK